MRVCVFVSYVRVGFQSRGGGEGSWEGIRKGWKRGLGKQDRGLIFGEVKGNGEEGREREGENLCFGVLRVNR